MSMNLELTGKRVLVTAGTKGIGGAVAGLFRQHGANVLAVARVKPEQLSPDAFVAADLTTIAGCDAVVQAVGDRLGGVDSIVHVLGGSLATAGGFAALDDQAPVRRVGKSDFGDSGDDQRIEDSGHRGEYDEETDGRTN